MGGSPHSTPPPPTLPADRITPPSDSLRRSVAPWPRPSPSPPLRASVPSGLHLPLLRPRLEFGQAGAGVALVGEGDADLRGGDGRERHVVHAAAGGALRITDRVV